VTSKSGRTDELRQLGQYVEQHPLGMVAAAFGTGYLLSGALFSPATARILGLGLRFGLRFATPSLVRAAFGGDAPFNPGNTGNTGPRPHPHAKESP
jgi:hypothetical protein